MMNFDHYPPPSSSNLHLFTNPNKNGISNNGNGSTSSSSRSKLSAWKLPGAIIDGVRTRLKDRRSNHRTGGQQDKQRRSRSKSPEWDWRRQVFGHVDPYPGSETFTSFAGNLDNTDHSRADTLPRSQQANGHPPPLVRSNSTGTTASVTSSDYGFQDWSSTKNPKAAVLKAMRPSRKRGKSVRFGENRINVFLQDPNQALEEVVRLALGYTEQQQSRAAAQQLSGSAGALSDTEAITTLSRTSAEIHANPASFWSDSEARSKEDISVDEDEDEDFKRGFSAAAAALLALQTNPAYREAFFRGTNGSSSPPSRHKERVTATVHEEPSSNQLPLTNGVPNLSNLRRERKPKPRPHGNSGIQPDRFPHLAQNNNTECSDSSDYPRLRYGSSKHDSSLVGQPYPPAFRADSLSTTTSRQTSSCSTSSCSYRPSNSSSQSSQQHHQHLFPKQYCDLPQSHRKSPIQGLTPDEALQALQLLTRLSSSSSSKGSKAGSARLSNLYSAFSDSDCDDDEDDAASVLSVASRLSVHLNNSKVKKGQLSDLDPKAKSMAVQQRSASPSAAMLLSMLNDTEEKQRSVVARQKRPSRPKGRRKTNKGHKSGKHNNISADIFATILLCSEDSPHGFSQGMSLFKHVHSKITQDVCNAIFLCKVQRIQILFWLANFFNIQQMILIV